VDGGVKKEFLGRGWAFPFRIDAATGGVATSVAEDNIRECMALILATRPGERQMMPEFGCRIHELIYTPNTSANASLVAYHVQAALQRWEPRIDVIEVQATPTTTGKVSVNVRYRVKSTLAEQVLSLDVAQGG
jgi:phage baseplate assembly protein W